MTKVFAKEFMARHRVPTARFAIVHEASELSAQLETFPERVVVRASGLAAGKGVVLCSDRSEAHAVASAMLSGASFGAAGETVVLEETLSGVEMTMLVLVSADMQRIGEQAKHFSRVVLSQHQTHMRLIDQA